MTEPAFTTREAQQERRSKRKRRDGQLKILGGIILTLAGIAFAVWAISQGVRSNTGVALSLPIAAGIFLIINGLYLKRSGEVIQAPDWIGAISLSNDAEQFDLLATSTGIRHTWIIDGQQLFDPKGNAHDLATLRGGRTMQNGGPQGWSRQLTLLFDGGKTSVKAAGKPRDTANLRLYEAFGGRLEAILQQNDPSATFKSGNTHSLLIGFGVAAVVLAGLLLGATLLG